MVNQCFPNSYRFWAQRSIFEGVVIYNVEHHVSNCSIFVKALEDYITIVRKCEGLCLNSSRVRAQSSCKKKALNSEHWQQHSESMVPTPNGYLSTTHYITNLSFEISSSSILQPLFTYQLVAITIKINKKMVKRWT